MDFTKKSSGTGLIFSLLGLVACITSLFLPWFDNTQIKITGLTTVATFGVTLMVIIAGGILIAAVLAFYTRCSEGKRRLIFCGLRALCTVFAAYALMGVRKLMINGKDNLPVTLLVGAYVMLSGLALLLIGTVSDLLTTRKSGKKTSTINLVLIVMTAAIYAAALLTLSFIKLAPGTWLDRKSVV